MNAHFPPPLIGYDKAAWTLCHFVEDHLYALRGARGRQDHSRAAWLAGRIRSQLRNKPHARQALDLVRARGGFRVQ